MAELDDRPKALEVVRGKIARNRGQPPLRAAGRALSFIGATARSKVQLRKMTSIGVGVRVLGKPPLIHNHGTIRLGNDIGLESRTKRIYFNVFPGAELVLEDGVNMNEGVRFDCTCSIQIGAGTLIGYGVVMLDNDFHGLYDRQTRPPGQPIVVEHDVWIGVNAMILPGVTVGAGSVIAGGAVVREDVPAFTMVAGNPAHVVRTLDPEKLPDAAKK